MDYQLAGKMAYVSAGALASPLARFITGAALDIGGTIRGLI